MTIKNSFFILKDEFETFIQKLISKISEIDPTLNLLRQKTAFSGYTGMSVFQKIKILTKPILGLTLQMRTKK